MKTDGLLIGQFCHFSSPMLHRSTGLVGGREWGGVYDMDTMTHTLHCWCPTGLVHTGGMR